MHFISTFKLTMKAQAGAMKVNTSTSDTLSVIRNMHCILQYFYLYQYMWFVNLTYNNVFPFNIVDT